MFSTFAPIEDIFADFFFALLAASSFRQVRVVNHFCAIERPFLSLRIAHLFDFFKGVFQDMRIFEKTIAKYYEKQLNNIGIELLKLRKQDYDYVKILLT